MVSSALKLIKLATESLIFRYTLAVPACQLASQLRLSKDITQILVPPETYSGFVREFPALRLVDL